MHYFYIVPLLFCCGCPGQLETNAGGKRDQPSVGTGGIVGVGGGGRDEPCVAGGYGEGVADREAGVQLRCREVGREVLEIGMCGCGRE